MIIIDSKYFYAGVVLNDKGIVVRCAPIVKYMRLWTIEQVKAYCIKKKWKLEVIP